MSKSVVRQSALTEPLPVLLFHRTPSMLPLHGTQNTLLGETRTVLAGLQIDAELAETRSQAVARIADRTASQLWGHVTI